MADHSGAVAVVTGASRGIGLGIAQRLVDEGARVVITARKPEPLAEAVAQLGEDNAVGVAGNSSDEAHQAQVVATAARPLRRADLPGQQHRYQPALRPDARLGPRGGPQGARRQRGHRGVVDPQGDRRRAGLWRPPGAVVNVGSIAAFGASPMAGWYGVSKAALVHLTMELGLQLAPGIRVNAVAPGLVKTRFAAAIYEGREERDHRRVPARSARHPRGRRGRGVVPALPGRGVHHRADPRHRRRVHVEHRDVTRSAYPAARRTTSHWPQRFPSMPRDSRTSHRIRWLIRNLVVAGSSCRKWLVRSGQPGSTGSFQAPLPHGLQDRRGVQVAEALRDQRRRTRRGAPAGAATGRRWQPRRPTRTRGP